MKNETYETLVDGIIEASIIFLWLCLIYGIAFLVTSSIFLIYKFNFNIEASFIWVCLVPSGVISLPVTLFAFYFRKAKKLYDIKRFRDFWLGFGHSVDLPGTLNESSEVIKWLEENMRHMYVRHRSKLQTYHFISKSDAMAFKIRWYE